MKGKKVSLEEFKKALSQISEVKSVTDSASYHSVHVADGSILFIRDKKNEYESIPVSELYSFYKNVSDLSEVKTTIAKKYISDRVQSPATAILKELITNTLK